jgi:hypothetical protein
MAEGVDMLWLIAKVKIKLLSIKFAFDFDYMLNQKNEKDT